MSAWDLCGLVGVSLILAAYAGAQARRLDPTRALSLVMNLAGSGLIIVSLLRAFNLSALLVEVAWAAIAAFGLIRLALQRRR
ncbi:MAG TPA: hypothetical protein VK801_19095 [Caulobacteraceae bacterium]|nr:hypothetical protein [Caulobacteraceae bacterium]